MSRELEGNVALVTGSGRGLGRAIAARLAELGAAVAIHDVRADAPAEFGEAANLEEVRLQFAEFGVPTAAVLGDIADEDAVAAMVAQAEATLGPITILVNCAGGDIAAKGGKPKPNDALGVPMVDVRAILDRNLIGTMMLCRAVCPGMIARKHGSVINIASIAAHAGSNNEVAYAVAKAGIVHYSRCLSTQLRPDGVRVNVVSPGPTRTARFVATRVTDPQKMDDSAPSLERYGTPSEVADAVAFFAGDRARFVSGQVIRVDGGFQSFTC
jgi:3-oxoacyl-[acyl-carrier protein] reductase